MDGAHNHDQYDQRLTDLEEGGMVPHTHPELQAQIDSLDGRVAALESTEPPTEPPTELGILVGPAYQNPYTASEWATEYPFWTGGQPPIVAEVAAGLLVDMRDAGQQMIATMAGGSGNYLTDGFFDFDKWKAQLDAMHTLGIDDHIGTTIVANYLIDEPKWHGSWGGMCVPNDVLDDMAAYSKTLWPTLPTVVRAEPDYLIDKATAECGPWPGGYQWQHLDAAWCQYTTRKGQIDHYMATKYQAAQQQGLGLVCGINWRDGGSGESNIQSPLGNTAWWCCSPSEVLTFANGMLNDTYPDVSGFIMWKRVTETKEPTTLAYWQSDGMQEAFADLKALCASRPDVPLLRR